jgi:hypothetical protein
MTWCIAIASVVHDIGGLGLVGEAASLLDLCMCEFCKSISEGQTVQEQSCRVQLLGL